MKLRCEDARPLVPSYLDGELEEDRAGPLRSHLLDCRNCREVAKDGKSLGRWFEAVRESSAPASAPQGFASRVAGLAFAGPEPTAEPTVELMPEPRAAAQASQASARRPLLPFLLTLTSLAAAILFVLAIMIQRQSVPTGGALEAGEDVPWIENGSQTNAPYSPGSPGEYESEDPTAAHEDDAER